MKEKILRHCLEILWENYFMTEINLEQLERQAKKEGWKNTTNYDVNKTSITKRLEDLTNQIEIAQEMIKKYETA